MLYSLADKKILVVGDIMLDRYWRGETSRTSPEAPVPIVDVKHIENRVGGCGNVALNIQALTGQTHVLSVIGQDEAGDVLKTDLTAASVAYDFVEIADRPTTTKLRVLSHQQQMIRLDFEENCQSVDKRGLLTHFAAQLPEADLVIFSDYAKGALADIQTMIAEANAQGVLTLVDPKGRDFSRYQGATLIKPNLAEFEAIVGSCSDDETLESKARALLEELSLEALLITRGAQGMTLVQRDKLVRHVPATSKELSDVTGAGDTVIATLGLAMAAGYTPLASMHLANLAAGIVVEKLGTSTVSLQELQAAYASLRNLPKGVTTREKLAKAVKEVQQLGKDVVFTNGCFDLLHAGHVTYLQKAREQGDFLVVAVNDDASIQRLKGPERPISPLDSRMDVLAALGCVDWAVSFHEDTPENLLHELQPNVLVKGADYQIDEIVGAPIVFAYGGRVERIAHDRTDISTTQLLEKARR